MADSSTLKLKDVILCRWCRGNLSLSSKLVQFECLHHGCIDCLTQNVGDLQPGTLFSCPECDVTCIIPLEGVDGICEEPLLQKMKAIADIHANNHPLCQSCEQLNQTRNSSHVCVTCKVYLCEEDAVRHRVLSDHKIVTIQELQSGSLITQMLQSRADQCPKHSCEKKYFCEDCKIQICMECVVLDHSTCQKIAIEKAANEFKASLGAKVEKLAKAENIAKEKVENSKKDLEAMQNDLKETMKLHKRGRQSRQTSETTRIANMAKRARKQTDIEKMKNEALQKKIIKLQMVQQYVKIFLEYCSDSEIVAKQLFLSGCLDEWAIDEDSGKERRGIQPVCTIQGTPTEEFKEKANTQKDETYSFSFTRTFTRMFGFGGGGRNGQESWENRLVSCTLEYKWKAPVTIMKIGFRRRTIHKPRRKVIINQEDILFFESSKLVKCGIDGLKKNDIKFEQNFHDADIYDKKIYAMDTTNRIVVVMDMNGQIIRQLETPPREHLGYGSKLKIAVDQTNGDVMVASHKRNMVYKFKAGTGKAIEWITQEISFPTQICVTPESELLVRGESYVSKRDGYGNRKWGYGKVLESNKFEGMCVDHTGQIFLSDYENHRIHIVSPHGQLLGFVDIGEEILCPQDIAFKDERLVVTTHFENTVYVIKCIYK